MLLDELGYLPFAQAGGQLLFHLVSKLYERSPITATSLRPATRAGASTTEPDKPPRAPAVDALRISKGLRASPPGAQALSELAAIYRDTPVGLAIIGVDTRFQRINTRLAQMNGLSAEAHIGRTVREIFPKLADLTEKLIAKIEAMGRCGKAHHGARRWRGSGHDWWSRGRDSNISWTLHRATLHLQLFQAA